MTVRSILTEAEKLSVREQAELIEELMIRFHANPASLELTPAQEEDLDRRIAEYRAGKAKMIPGDEVIKMLRKRD